MILIGVHAESEEPLRPVGVGKIYFLVLNESVIDCLLQRIVVFLSIAIEIRIVLVLIPRNLVVVALGPLGIVPRAVEAPVITKLVVWRLWRLPRYPGSG